MGRKKRYHERMIAPCTAGTFSLMDEVLEEGESRTDLVRMAIQRELVRRWRALAKKDPTMEPSIRF